MIPLSATANLGNVASKDSVGTDGTLPRSVGRPTAEERGEEISESNEITREHDSNASR